MWETHVIGQDAQGSYITTGDVGAVLYVVSLPPSGEQGQLANRATAQKGEGEWHI